MKRTKLITILILLAMPMAFANETETSNPISEQQQSQLDPQTSQAVFGILLTLLANPPARAVATAIAANAAGSKLSDGCKGYIVNPGFQNLLVQFTTLAKLGVLKSGSCNDIDTLIKTHVPDELKSAREIVKCACEAAGL